MATAWTLIEYSFLKGIPGAFIWSAVWVLKYAFRMHSWLRSIKEGLVKDGADYLQTEGSSRPLPLKYA
jgi:hypothetical protein